MNPSLSLSLCIYRNTVITTRRLLMRCWSSPRHTTRPLKRRTKWPQSSWPLRMLENKTRSGISKRRSTYLWHRISFNVSALCLTRSCSNKSYCLHNSMLALATRLDMTGRAGKGRGVQSLLECGWGRDMMSEKREHQRNTQFRMNVICRRRTERESGHTGEQKATDLQMSRRGNKMKLLTAKMDVKIIIII